MTIIAASPLATPAEPQPPLQQQVTEWEHGTWLLHQVDRDHYQLFDPECRDVQPLDFLAEYGLLAGWWFWQETVGCVLVTHIHRF